MQVWNTLDWQQSGIKLELPTTNKRLMTSPSFTAIQLLENELSISLSVSAKRLASVIVITAINPPSGVKVVFAPRSRLPTCGGND